MNAEPPYGGAVLIADTSARMRTNEPSVREDWIAAVEGDQIATCSIVTMELLFSARDATGVAETERVEATFRQIPVSASVQRAAIGAVRKLSEKGGAGRHRVPPPDVLIAAAAEDAGIGVLHYDRHFDRLAEVLSFESVWIAPSGSL